MSDKLVLLDYLTLRGNLRCITGLHIGAPADAIEIGGMDNPIIKHPLTGLPYVPGSSLKGKMRALLELRYNKIDARPEVDGRRNPGYGEVHRPSPDCEKGDCLICRLFGSSAGEGQLGPTRLIVRDAYLTEESENEMSQKLTAGEPFTEVKHENTINRITAMANPRSMERVPAGVGFAFEIGYRVFDTGDGGATDRDLFRHVAEGLQLVVVDTLGGSGSRGYGKVAFEKLSLTNLAGQTLLKEASLDALLALKL
jgi:CRISPR-associated protein Csm3